MGKSTNAAITAIIFLIFFAGCAPSGNGSGSNPQALIVSSQSTIGAAQVAIDQTAAASARATADAQRMTAEAWIAETAVAANVTAEAIMIADQATREAQMIADQATRESMSTRQSLEVEQTAVALQMSIDEATRQADAFNYAAAVTIQAEQAREKQRMLNVEMARVAETRRLESAQFWANVREGLYALAILFGALLLVAAIVLLIMIGLAAISRARKLNQEPVQQFRDDAQGTNIFVIPQGLFSSEIRTIAQPRITAPDQPAGLIAAPQPIRDIQPLSNLGHMLIAGGSGSGKSSLMRWALNHWQGETVVVDPHAALEEWNADRVIGRGGNFDEINGFFLWMQAELRDRMAIRGRARSEREINFAPLTVATDELPAIVSTLGNEGKQAWIEWIEQGRKFGLFVILSSQSTRVKSLGISGKGDLRDQFSAVVSLGSEATRRFPDLAMGMTRPAILELEGNPQPERVNIPYVPPFTGSRNGSDFTAHPSGFITVEQQPEPVETAVAGIETDGGFVPAEEIQKIVDAWNQLEKPSLRKVAKAIYSSTGGKGFYKTRAALESRGIV